jgi:hypothetical protein
VQTTGICGMQIGTNYQTITDYTSIAHSAQSCVGSTVLRCNAQETGIFGTTIEYDAKNISNYSIV